MQSHKPKSKREKADILLEELYASRHPDSLDNEIRKWYFDDADRNEKDEALETVFYKEVNEVSVPDETAYNKLQKIILHLGLPQPTEAINDIRTITHKIRSRGRIIPLRRLLLTRAAAVLILLICSTVGLLIVRTADTTEGIADIIVSADGGNRQTVSLPDGSTITLYPGTELTHPADFTNDRHVALIGKAFFEVAKDEERQFSVAADGLIVTVHGTEFMVTAFEGAENAKVSLHSGSVEVVAGDQRSVLSPGQQLEYFHELGEVVISQVEPEDWTKPNLDFNMRPFAEILTSLGDYYGTAIEADRRDSTRYTIDLTGSGDAESALRLLLGMAREFTYEKEQDTIKIRTKLN